MTRCAAFQISYQQSFPKHGRITGLEALQLALHRHQDLWASMDKIPGHPSGSWRPPEILWSN